MNIDWDKLKTIKSRDTTGILTDTDYKLHTIKDLRKELEERGLKYTGSKTEMLLRLRQDNDRIETAEADGQLKSLESLQKRVVMFEEYEEVAMKEWTAAKERWDAAVARKYKVLEEKDLAEKAYVGYKEALRLQGYDVSAFD